MLHLHIYMEINFQDNMTPIFNQQFLFKYLLFILTLNDIKNTRMNIREYHITLSRF